MLDGAHDFSIDKAHLAGRDIYVHYANESDEKIGELLVMAQSHTFNCGHATFEHLWRNGDAD